MTLLVDREDGEPVDHEFTKTVARRVSPALDEVGYDGLVEVSSPGIARPLTKPVHFRRFAGREARVKTLEPVVGGPHDGRSNFAGIIERTDEGGFTLGLTEGGEVRLPFENVARAHLKEEL